MSTDHEPNMLGADLITQSSKGDVTAAAKATKSQKRKKSKKTAAAAAAAKKETEVSKTALMQGLNPHHQLRTKLLAEGFTEKQIDDAMEEMWSSNLAYDDFDAVCDFLRGGEKEKDSRSQLSEQTTQSNPEEENTTTSTAASTVAAAMTPPSEGDFVLGFSPVEEEKEGDYDSNNSRNGSNTQAPSLAAKLEMVARYENLVDAAFALTEWTTKAAKPHEVCDSGVVS